MADEAQSQEVKLSEDGLLNAFFQNHYTPEELEEVKKNQDSSQQSSEPSDEEKAKLAADEAAKIEADKKAKELESQAQAPDLNKLIEEKTAGRFKSVEDLATIPESFEPKYANDESKALYEAILAGKETEVLDYLQRKNANYDNVSDIDMLKAKYKSEHPYVSDEDVAAEIQDQYNLDIKISDTDKDTLTAEQYEEKEKKIARAQRIAKRDAAEYRKQLADNKPNLKLPEFESKPAAPALDEAAEAEARGMQIWVDSIKQGSEMLPGSIDHMVAAEVGEGEDKVSYSTSFKIEGDDQKALAQYVRTFTPPIGREEAYIKDGKVDVQAITNEGIEKLFGKKMYTALLRESLAKQRAELIKGIKNLEDDPTHVPPATELTQEEFLSKAINF